MALPKISELYDSILAFLRENGEIPLNKIRQEMALSFYVPDEEAFEEREQKYSIFENHVNYACWDLCRAGLIERTRIGFYALSPKGDEAVGRDDYIDRDYLWDVPEFRDYVISRRGEPSVKPEDRKEEAGGQDKRVAHIIHRQKPEFILVQQPTLKQIAKLKRQDTRFANMIASGCFLYEGGCIKEVPQEVRMQDVSYQDFKDQNLFHGADNSAVLCYQDANGSGKMVSAPPKSISGYHRNPKGPDKWTNPLPWVVSSGAGLYPAVSGALDHIRKNRDFCVCMKHLLKNVYKITQVALAQKSGIDIKKIQRLVNNPKEKRNITELIAIFWVLKAHPSIIEAMLELAGISHTAPQYEPYIVMCTLTVHSTYKEVNDLCRQEGLQEIFPKSLENQVP